jgi:hypothetical protein
VLRLEAALASKVVGAHGGSSTPRYRTLIIKRRRKNLQPKQR